MRPIGGHTEIAVDARVVTATNRNLHREISAGKFREDLFYRIAVMTIDTPPLRKRSSDIPLLVEHFLRQAEQKMRCPYRHKIEEQGLATLSAYTWPGNVRQLRNVIERLVATTFEIDVITIEAILRALPASLLPRWLRSSLLCSGKMTRSMISLIGCFFALMSSCENRPAVTAKPHAFYGLIGFRSINASPEPGSELATVSHQETLVRKIGFVEGIQCYSFPPEEQSAGQAG